MKKPFEEPLCMYGPPPEMWRPEHKFDTLVFDLGGVLMQHGMKRCIDAFREMLGPDQLQKYLGLGDDGEGSEDSLMIRFEQGLVSADDFVEDILSHAKPGVTRQDIIDAWLLMHAGIPQERLDYVRELHDRGFHIYLLSNNNELHWKDVCEHYPINEYFDDMFLSQEMHMSKPDPRMFKKISESIGSDPKKTIFIDDLEQNRIEAEHAVGWKTCASVDELKDLLG